MTNHDFLSDVELISNNFPDFEISHSENKFIEFHRGTVFKLFLRKDAEGYALRVPWTATGGDSYRKSDTLSLKLSKKDIKKIENIIKELSL